MNDFANTKLSLRKQHNTWLTKKNAAEFLYGAITGKYVIYRGETVDEDGIHYMNVEEYLKGLGKAVTP